MTEELIIKTSESKQEIYKSLIPQLEGLIYGEANFIANVSNIIAAIKQTFNHLWVGVYFVDSEDELVLGPFQGPIACTRIKKGKGVCGSTWQEAKTFIVDDVNKFTGHIACSSLTQSEIVCPIFNASNEIIGVLDIDSEHLATFNEVDKMYLEKICSIIQSLIA